MGDFWSKLLGLNINHSIFREHWIVGRVPIVVFDVLFDVETFH